MRWWDRRQALIDLFNYNHAALLRRRNPVFQTCRHVGITMSTEFAWLVAHIQFDSALDYKDEPLRDRATQFAAGFKFRCVLRKSRAQYRSRMHNRRAPLHTG